MKEVALTIKPHWAYAIFHLGKDIENRTWALPEKYEGQRVWIHSGKTLTKKELSEFSLFLASNEIPHKGLDDLLRFYRGGIVGSVEFLSAPDYLIRSKWKMEGYNGWKIKNKVLLPESIPAKGKLGFWDCTELVQHLI